MLFRVTLKRSEELQITSSVATLYDALSLLQGLEKGESISFEVNEANRCIRCDEYMDEETMSVNNNNVCDYCYHVGDKDE